MAQYRRHGQRPTKEEKQLAQQKFLEIFAQSANVSASCRAAGIHRNAVYHWLELDAEFSLLYKQAELDANDRIRAELFRRAIDGIEKPVVSAGKLVYTLDGEPLTILEYSDSLLSLLAKARLPEFKDQKQTEQPTIQNFNTFAVDLSKLTGEELATLKDIAKRAEGRA
jgi:hypothetical protein